MSTSSRTASLVLISLALALAGVGCVAGEVDDDDEQTDEATEGLRFVASIPVRGSVLRPTLPSTYPGCWPGYGSSYPSWPGYYGSSYPSWPGYYGGLPTWPSTGQVSPCFGSVPCYGLGCVP